MATPSDSPYLAAIAERGHAPVHALPGALHAILDLLNANLDRRAQELGAGGKLRLDLLAAVDEGCLEALRAVGKRGVDLLGVMGQDVIEFRRLPSDSGGQRAGVGRDRRLHREDSAPGCRDQAARATPSTSP